MKRTLKVIRLAKYALPDDAENIRFYQQGEIFAFNELWHRYQPGMLLYATAIVGPWLADDVMQDTWKALLKIWHNGSYREEQQFREYIKSIVYHIALDTLDKERRFGMSLDEQPEQQDDTMNAEEMVLKKEALKMLGHALKKVGAYAARVVILHGIKGKTFKEISNGMKQVVKEATLRVLYFRTLKEIRRILLPYQGNFAIPA